MANAVPPTQPSSHKEPAGSGEWVGTYSWNHLHMFLLHFAVSVSPALQPAQPSSHRESAGYGEWLGTVWIR